MQGDHATLLQTLTRMQQFLSDNRDAVSSFITPPLLDRFARAREELREHELVQEVRATGDPSETLDRRQRQESLVRSIRVLQSVARLAGVSIPALAAFGTKSPPRAGARLVTHARALAAAAEPIEATLVAAGAPPGFIADLWAEADSLQQSLDGFANRRTRRAATTAGLRAEAREARAIVRVMNTLMVAHLTDAKLLGAWASASGIRAIGLSEGRAGSRSLAAAPPLRMLPPAAVSDAETPLLPTPEAADQPSPALAPTPEGLLKRFAKVFAQRPGQKAG
jgi:hypothetical protein